MPDLPTVAESGVKGYSGSSWQGLAAPAGTPPEILNRIQAEVARMLQDPKLNERILTVLGGIPVGNRPEEFTQFVSAEVEKWGKVAKAARITLN
jgi:tripartite-type tricarboxylate transporter receptor subunit TctC